MWENIKDAVGRFFTQIVFPGVLWDGIKAIGVLLLSFLGLYKAKEAWSILAAGTSVSLGNRILLGTCAVICGLNIICLLVYLIFGVRTYRKQKENQAQLDTERARLAEEKEKMNSEAAVPAFPLLESRYSISNVEIELYFKDREHIIQRQEITYRVRGKPLTSISHTMYWTGDGYGGSHLDEASIRKGYRLEETESSASSFKITVIFPEERQPGFEDTYCVVTEVTDSRHQMMPFLSRLIKCPTSRLSLKITAPDGMIQSCKQMVTADISSDFILSDPKPVRSELVGSLRCYRRDFTKLELLRYYRLKWIFADQGPAHMGTQKAE